VLAAQFLGQRPVPIIAAEKVEPIAVEGDRQATFDLSGGHRSHDCRRTTVAGISLALLAFWTKEVLMRTLITALSALLLVSVLVSGCQSAKGKTVGQNVDDTKITTEVKAKLVADRMKNLTSVHVNTEQGVVSLTGNVETNAQKADAERIARDVTGVQRVVNNLAVTGSPAASAAAVTGESFAGRHSMTGRVTMIDPDRGHVHLQTAEAGELILHFPPAALQNVKKSDQLTVEMAVKPER
jgi:hypothetical protein